MNLSEFIDSREHAAWIKEPGLKYYVRKSRQFIGLIELSNCTASPKSKKFGYWRFLKRYEKTIPFIAEQVMNPDLAKLYEMKRWIKRDIGGIPQYASPLAMERFKDNQYFRMCYMKEAPE